MPKGLGLCKVMPENMVSTMRIYFLKIYLLRGKAEANCPPKRFVMSACAHLFTIGHHKLDFQLAAGFSHG